MWQHEETGNVGFVDAWQVANNWTENNPRLRLIAPLYRRSSPSSSVLERARDAFRPFVDCNFTYFGGKVIGADRRLTREDVEAARSALAEIDRALGGGNGK